LRTSWSRRSRLSASFVSGSAKRGFGCTVEVMQELSTSRADIAADERGAQSGMNQSGCLAISQRM
jgi:hypothetical protein